MKKQQLLDDVIGRRIYHRKKEMAKMEVSYLSGTDEVAENYLPHLSPK